MENNAIAKQTLGYYLCQTALKTAIPFKSEKDFSNNHCLNYGFSYWHCADTDLMDQEYDRCRTKTVPRQTC